VNVDAIRVLYLAAALLEIAGISLVFVGVRIGRRRARVFRAIPRPHAGTVMRFGNRVVRDAERWEQRSRRFERENESEIANILEGNWTAVMGAFLLIVGVIIGTIGNVANT
jgi:hypothetical protein